MKCYSKCDETINLYNKGSLPPESGCNAAQTLEAKISEILNAVRGASGKVGFFFFFFVE